MSDPPRAPGLRTSPLHDPETICEKKYLGSISPRYSFSRTTYKFKSRVFDNIGATGDPKVVKSAKEFYRARGLQVRVKKHEAKSYGVYWTFYVGNGKWHEYTSSSRMG